MTARAITFLTHIVKRDGVVMPFDREKILYALLRAGQATGEFDYTEAEELTLQVMMRRVQLHEPIAPHVEQIQDIVENVLFDGGYRKTLRAYIAYREQHSSLRGDRSALVDAESWIDEYLGRPDGHANANQNHSPGNLLLGVSQKVIANYWLNHVYPQDVADAHRKADIHIHDLGTLAGYCTNWSPRILLKEGLNGVPGEVESAPPQHLSSAIGQIVNFLGALQAEWAGPQAFGSFDTHMAAFVRKDRMTYEQVRQAMQELVCNLNAPSRSGVQTPLTTLTFDWTCPDDLRKQVPVIGGREMDFTYGDLQAEMDMINRAFIEVMMSGDAKGHAYAFPVPTYCITGDFDWFSPNAELLFEMTARFGLPYFQNFVNSDRKPELIRRVRERRQIDPALLLTEGSGLFGSPEQSGSLGVVTINCARLGFAHRGNETSLIEQLDRLLELGKTSLEIKRKLVERQMNNGLFPYSRRYLGTLCNHSSTMGVTGINEMIRNFTDDKHDITTKWGKAFALRLLDHMRERMQAFQCQTDNLYNLEATSSEATTTRFALEDNRRFREIIQAGTNDIPCYTDSSQLPAGFTDDPFEALEQQEELQCKYTGDTVLHLYFGGYTASPDACRKLVKRALSRFRLPCITVSLNLSVRPKHGYLSGGHQFYPRCDEKILTRKMREEEHG